MFPTAINQVRMRNWRPADRISSAGSLRVQHSASTALKLSALRRPVQGADWICRIIWRAGSVTGDF